MGVRRDQVSKGDDVDVIVHVADGMPPKRHRARVLKVLRAGVKVRFYDNQPTGRTNNRTVRLNDIELPIRKEKKRKPPKPKVPPVPPRRPTPPPPPPEPKPEPDEEPDDPLADLEAWLAMGRDMVEPLKEQLLELEAEMVALDDEAAEIEREKDRVAANLGEVKRRLRSLQKVIEVTK